MSTQRLDNVRVAVRPLNRYRRPTQRAASDEPGNTNKFNRYIDQENHTICRNKQLRSGATVNCRLVFHAKPGRNRYACISSTTGGVNTLARRSVRTTIDGKPAGPGKKQAQ